MSDYNAGLSPSPSARFLATYRRWDGTTTQTCTSSLGRCYDEASAASAAKQRYGGDGYELLTVRQETAFEAARHKVLRFVVRSLRIAAGVVLAFFAYVWLSGATPDIGDVPLSQLTVNIILTRLFHVGLIIGSAALCWFIAFGDAPKEDGAR